MKYLSGDGLVAKLITKHYQAQYLSILKSVTDTP
jgi:hypothetical protein